VRTLLSIVCAFAAVRLVAFGGEPGAASHFLSTLVLAPEARQKLAGGGARNERNHRTVAKMECAPEGALEIPPPLPGRKRLVIDSGGSVRRWRTPPPANFCCASGANRGVLESEMRPEPGMVLVPGGKYAPLYRGEKDAKEIAVASFQLDERPVTNGEFLAFVRENPKWQRAQVKRLFADERYLAHWAGDLDPGNADATQPVTNVSWFAAKAFAAARGRRLPTTAEWEFAAGAGFTSADGANDLEFQKAIARWYGTPSPAVLPAAGSGRANVFGIRDLHGLVWEWTSDFNSALVTGDARGDTGLDRQLFCGSGSVGAKDTGNYAAFMRFGMRSSLKAAYTVHNLGFRTAKDIEPK